MILRNAIFFQKLEKLKTQGLKQTRHGVGGRRIGHRPTPKTRTIHPTVLARTANKPFYALQHLAAVRRFVLSYCMPSAAQPVSAASGGVSTGGKSVTRGRRTRRLSREAEERGA